MNRREFIGQMAATGVISRASFARAAPTLAEEAFLRIGDGAPGPTIPRDFTGLSYEAAQLANPVFFSAKNHALVELFRGLSSIGNLRIGGGSSEFTTYSDVDPVGPPPFEVFGPDTSKTVKRGTTTTALALRHLRDFLDAVGWRCLYGLNLGQGTKENAAAEAAAVFDILGPRLMAFQIGNEPDSFRNRYRPTSYRPEDYLKEWNVYHDAIVATTPGAKFAGPDISNKLDYLTAFAAEAHLHSDVMLLTGHFYSMGPASSPDATLDQLFDPDPKLATIHLHNLPVIENAIKTAKLPFRMSEGNSCWDGGKSGVSDTLASAIWCADMMLRFAQMGWCGVNLHGGGNGFYTPIAGAPSTGFVRRPEYFGIAFVQRLIGATFLPISITGAGRRVTAYALEQDGQRRVVIFNKQDIPLNLLLPARPHAHIDVLSGPSFESKREVSIASVRISPTAHVTVPARAGVLYDL